MGEEGREGVRAFLENRKPGLGDLRQGRPLAADPEIELAAPRRWAALDLVARPKPCQLGSPCANCGTPLQGPYCHVCGQLAESFERSIWSLLKEAVENFFEADGRVVYTLPGSSCGPRSLTKAYLAGHRASQTPPFRLFLVVVVAGLLCRRSDTWRTPANQLLQVRLRAGHATVDLGVSSDPEVRP